MREEAEAVCDRIIIIDKGVIVADEDKNTIYSKINQGKQIIKVSFDRKISDNELLSIPNVSNARLTDKDFWLLESDSAEDIRPAVFSFAVKNNLAILSLLRREENNLEEVFRHLTGM